MQHVTAFSRPQTVPPVPSAAPKRNLWILDSWRDLILYVGTPLLILPIFAIAQARWSAQDIYIFVAAFGAMGHHLPGMIRAYGDRALFERFRGRFILAPIFLLAVCVAFYWWDLKGIVLVVFFWGVWHGMMQTYGFCRIYDAKMGSFAALTRRLDFAVCAVWFAAAVLLSTPRMADTLDAYYASGGPFIAPWVVHSVQSVLWWAAIAVSVLFLVNFGWMWRQGKRPNPVKLALLITSIGFWWYCNLGVASILAGIALFEVFHDVQYLSLVWIYNRNRVEKDSSIGGFMRFVFRRSGSLIGLYIGLVMAYGSLSYFNSRLEIETIKRVLTGVVAASSLLHFYYDGFIWKVRERSTRESLGLSGGTVAGAAEQLVPSWLLHGFKWVGVFALPLLALGVGQIRGPAPVVDRAAWLVSDLPGGGRPHFKYGAALQSEGRLPEAVEQYRLALKYEPNEAETHYNLGCSLMGQSKFDDASEHFERALQLSPEAGNYRYDYAYTLERLGRGDEATAQYQAAVRFKPKSAAYHYDYGVHLLKTQKLNDAIAQFRLALQLNPNNAEANFKIATALAAKNELEAAKPYYLEAVRLNPDRAEVHNDLGNIYLRQGKISQAVVQYEEALRLDPHLQVAEENLRLAKASETRFSPP